METFDYRLYHHHNGDTLEHNFMTSAQSIGCATTFGRIKKNTGHITNS